MPWPGWGHLTAQTAAASAAARAGEEPAGTAGIAVTKETGVTAAARAGDTSQGCVRNRTAAGTASPREDQL